MVELRYIYVVVYAAVAVLALVVSFTAWRRRVAPGSLPLTVLMLGIAIWSACLAASWYVPTFEQQVFWLKMEGLGVWMVPVAFLTLGFGIAGMERWRAPRRIALISITSFVLAAVEWPNPGRLFDTAFVAHPMGPYVLYTSVPGPLYWGFVGYSYGLILICLVIILRVYIRSSGLERVQAAILFLGGLVPLLASVVTESRLVPLGGLDLAPLAFVITGTVWQIGIVRGALLDILPLARDAVVEQMSDGVIVVGGDGKVVDANATALAMLRLPLSEILGRPAEAAFGCVEGATALLDGGGPGQTVLPMDSDGDSQFVELGIAPLSVGPGKPPAQLVTLHDVTEERRAYERLELARTVFDTVDEGIVVMLPGEEHKIVDVNDAYCRLTGRSRHDTVGKGISFLDSDRHSPGFYTTMRRTVRTEGQWKGEVWQTRVNGTEFPSWTSVTVTKPDATHARHAVAVFTDITEIRTAEDKLKHGKTHDALTGLPNRPLLDDRLEHALAHARRDGSGLAVLFVDLDNFKTVNDTLGHAQGDALLVAIAKRLAGVMRESDTVARPGGDEFVILIADTPDPAYVEAAARRVLDAVASPCHVGDQDVHVTASIGIALFPADGIDATTLTKHADLAMYGAKGMGRNRIQFFSEGFQEDLDRRMAIEKELRGAEKEERYFLLYQPQVDLATGRITGAEALVRLRARDGALLSPAEFIPVAEDSELILRLGDWVLRKACSDVAILHEIAPDLIMSVNFSARQFGEMDVVSLHDVLQVPGMEAGSLELEITETAFLIDPQKSADKLAHLRDATGVRFALDDFGTGYSSLTYVRMFHPDTIKIDRSFVALLPDDPEAQAIVRSTIVLAKGLGATVVGEGPETEEQVRFLRANGCDTAQGYFFSRPVPADEFAALLRAGPFVLPDDAITPVNAGPTSRAK